MPDPTPEPRGIATPPTCEEFLQHVGGAFASTQQVDREDAREKLVYLAIFVLLVVAMVVGEQLFPEHKQRVRNIGMVVFLLVMGVYILVPTVQFVASLFRREKDGGWDYSRHILARHNCFIKNDGWPTATATFLVTPRFIGITKHRFLAHIPLYHTLVRPMRNLAQCIPLTPETQVRFSDPMRIARKMYRLDVSSGNFVDGDQVYLWPSEIRKLLPVLARLGVEVSCPRDL